MLLRPCGSTQSPCIILSSLVHPPSIALLLFLCLDLDLFCSSSTSPGPAQVLFLPPVCFSSSKVSANPSRSPLPHAIEYPPQISRSCLLTLQPASLSFSSTITFTSHNIVHIPDDLVLCSLRYHACSYLFRPLIPTYPFRRLVDQFYLFSYPSHTASLTTWTTSPFAPRYLLYIALVDFLSAN